jgi:hypothetical protein
LLSIDIGAHSPSRPAKSHGPGSSVTGGALATFVLSACAARTEHGAAARKTTTSIDEMFLLIVSIIAPSPKKIKN